MQEPEPLSAQPLNNELPLPGQSGQWTPRFIYILAFVLLVGAAAALYAFAGKSIANQPPTSTLNAFTASQLAGLALNIVFLAACLVGLALGRRALLRAGLLLQVIILLWAIFQAWPAFILAFQITNHNAPWMASLFLSLFFLFVPPTTYLAMVATGLLGVFSQICFSYVLARWQPSDKLFLWVQIAVILGLGTLIFKTSSLPSDSTWQETLALASSPYLGIAATACVLLRPACWKASPVIVLCFTAGAVALYLFDEVIERLSPRLASATQWYQLFSTIGLLGSTLVIVGVLLLIQRIRLQKMAGNTNLLAR